MFFFGTVKEWERHALFFLGRFYRMVEPGLYFYIPILTRVLFRIDLRIITYMVPMQEGLTKDNIPVEVDAVLFYQVVDPRACILNVDNYHHATQLGARTAIREMVGKSKLDELLAERDKIGARLKEYIDGFVSRWGVTVISVEIKDVIVAKELEDAIAREAAAEREKRARVILADAEVLAADAIVAASAKYADNPIALQLRSMNMLYEICLEGKSSVVFIPTDRSVGAMPSFMGITSLEELINKRSQADSRESEAEDED
ncbi:SPFH domain-containing protein [Gimesia maris]|uniref:SPFH domain-containing protein n=1 Tax=Gimesia maris TaxID=122 RepID=UPI00118A4F84|nr:SPFH domain-containing protein [Gimesia maris]QDT78136.1 Modulator of FtsH protease HflK [Gimesia maris]|tara:strand:+ start:239208 stop:239984 length:777 start_codon:yes stop_codon:yes gene_type:complete